VKGAGQLLSSVANYRHLFLDWPVKSRSSTISTTALKKKEEKEEANACAPAAKAQPERRVNINVSSDSVYNRFYDVQLRLRR